MASSERLSRLFWPVVALLVIAGAALRFVDLGGPSLWIDEMFTAMRAQASLQRMFVLVRESGNQTPFYYLALQAYPTGSEWALRSFSALLGLLGIVLLAYTVRQLYGRADVALWAAALLAVNPYHVWLSRNGRFYSLVFVLALLASYSFLWLINHQQSRVHWVLLVLSSAAAYITHYLTVALPVAQYVVLGFVLRRRRRFFRHWLLAQIVAGIPLLLWVIYLMRGGTVSAGINWIEKPAPEDILLTLTNMTVGYTQDVPWYALPGLALALAGLAIGVARTVRQPVIQTERWYWFWLVTLTLLSIFAVSWLLHPLYVDRYFALFLPGIILLVVYGWDTLAERGRPRWGAAAPWLSTGALAVIALTGLVQVITTIDARRYYKEEWEQAADYVAANFQPGDGVLAGTPPELLLFKRYFAVQDFAYSWTKEDNLQTIEPYQEPVSRVWMISHLTHRKTTHNNELVQPGERGSDPVTYWPPWVDQRRAQIIDQRQFNGITVFLVDTSEEATLLMESP